MSENTNSSRKRDAGFLYHIFLKSELIEIIKNIQNIENLKDENDVIIHLIQDYAKKNNIQLYRHQLKNSQSIQDVIEYSPPISKFDKLEFDGNVQFLKLEKILSSIQYTNSIKKLPQHEIYGLLGVGMIHRFHTKILPVKFTLMCLSKMIVENDTPWISLNELKKYTLNSAKNFIEKYNLSSICNKFKVNTGFPIKQVLHKDLDNSYLSYARSSKRFAEQFVGRKLQKHKGIQMGGACFEMELIDAKTSTYDWDEKADNLNNKKFGKIYVTLSESGKEFVSYKNDLIDFIYNSKEIKPESIFSQKEREFYFKKILPKFKFENLFVEHLMKYELIEHTRQIKIGFEEMFLKFCKEEFPEMKVLLQENTIRIYSNTIMSRLMEFGVFTKDPKSKSGPYTRKYDIYDLT